MKTGRKPLNMDVIVLTIHIDVMVLTIHIDVMVLTIHTLSEVLTLLNGINRYAVKRT